MFVFLTNFCSLATKKGKEKKKKKASFIDTRAFLFFFFGGREINGPKSPHYEGKKHLNSTHTKNKFDLEKIP